MVMSISVADRPRKAGPCSALSVAATASGTAHASTPMSRSAAAASAVRGGLLVVGVAGHAAVVEHDEQLCPLALRRPHHVGR
jgi:hypothetical protein